MILLTITTFLNSTVYSLSTLSQSFSRTKDIIHTHSHKLSLFSVGNFGWYKSQSDDCQKKASSILIFHRFDLRGQSYIFCVIIFELGLTLNFRNSCCEKSLSQIERLEATEKSPFYCLSEVSAPLLSSLMTWGLRGWKILEAKL